MGLCSLGNESLILQSAHVQLHAGANAHTDMNKNIYTHTYTQKCINISKEILTHKEMD